MKNTIPIASRHFRLPSRYDHYIALAREKALAGDCIEAETYYQQAEHYFRSAAALASPAQKVDQQQ
ncbi:DUF4167 domain-containing protein [Rhizobium rhizogenes]|nr:DUF4167 domain-containing protein [Rhizobium rhizogenes]QRM41628.1 DUF4167 domain-containing protein [Rhizobium rhizogenes]TQO76501.1 DUF4167 domain-containing protein [Rhizobium rhizogenes]TRB22273.1 DUF4167 domain-containing protein [Rhizobium rhizogenes]TRB56402.1 DUF4167 domain-containing protein [Rhizobium rhizogenes]